MTLKAYRSPEIPLPRVNGSPRVADFGSQGTAGSPILLPPPKQTGLKSSYKPSQAHPNFPKQQLNLNPKPKQNEQAAVRQSTGGCITPSHLIEIEQPRGTRIEAAYARALQQQPGCAVPTKSNPTTPISCRLFPTDHPQPTCHRKLSPPGVAGRKSTLGKFSSTVLGVCSDAPSRTKKACAKTPMSSGVRLRSPRASDTPHRAHEESGLRISRTPAVQPGGFPPQVRCAVFQPISEV